MRRKRASRRSSTRRSGGRRTPRLARRRFRRSRISKRTRFTSTSSWRQSYETPGIYAYSPGSTTRTYYATLYGNAGGATYWSVDFSIGDVANSVTTILLQCWNKIRLDRVRLEINLPMMVASQTGTSGPASVNPVLTGNPSAFWVIADNPEGQIQASIPSLASVNALKGAKMLYQNKAGLYKRTFKMHQTQYMYDNAGNYAQSPAASRYLPTWTSSQDTQALTLKHYGAVIYASGIPFSTGAGQSIDINCRYFLSAKDRSGVI